MSAGGVNDATVRTWIKNFDLRLGDRETRDSGNPRYDLADCARVFMLNQLCRNLQMSAVSAVWAVNKAWAHLALIAGYELDGMDDTTTAPACPRYILRLPATAMSVETNPSIRLFTDPDEVAERDSTRGKWLEIVMDLREIVRGARDRLVSTLGHSVAGLRHDFADALEG